jgi:thiamine biosynthesis lipoprotein
MLRERFHAMGTSMELLLEAPDAPDARARLGAARAEIERLEALLSRFRPDSELSQLNHARRMRVGPDLARVLSAALKLRQRTGGRFDPTLGRAIMACGYDRSFEGIADDERPLGDSAGGDGAVFVDTASGWVELGAGVDVDLGAIAKGDAADRACAILAWAGPSLVNAGGDIVVSGPRHEEPWPVAVATPRGRLVLNLETGALATSGTDRRRWWRAGQQHHHALEPSCGRSAATDVTRATAVACTGAEADALATALVIAGASGACSLADQWGVPAVLVDGEGDVRFAGGLR